jgi:cell division protein YceG involved in septum cleavage
MTADYTVNKPRKSGRRISILVVGLILLLGAGIYVYSYMKINRAGSSGSAAVTFSVPKGATTREVGQSLDDQATACSSCMPRSPGRAGRSRPATTPWTAR